MSEHSPKDESPIPNNPPPADKKPGIGSTPPEAKIPTTPETTASTKGEGTVNTTPPADGKDGNKPKRKYKPRVPKSPPAEGATAITASTAAQERIGPADVGITAACSKILKEAYEKILQQTDIPIPYAKLNEWAYSEEQLDKKVTAYCSLIREKGL